MRHVSTDLLYDAIHHALARAWISDEPREVSITPYGAVMVHPQERTPIGNFVVGVAYPAGAGARGYWEGV